MARLYQTTTFSALMVVCWGLVLQESVLIVEAYTPVCPLARNDVRSTSMQRSAVSFGAMDDSEWYAPPPAPKAAVVARPPTLNSKPLQTDVTTAQELARILNDNDDRLIILKFYASWCKSCAKVTLKMDQLASEHADWVAGSTDLDASTRKITKPGQVRIFNVEYGAARDLCVEQGIHQLPTIHMYTADRSVRGRSVRTKVQDFACPPRDFQRVRDLTKGYVLQQQSVKRITASSEKDLEAKLDAGRDMIQSSLWDEKTISSASLSDDAKSTRVLPRLWRRLRP